MTKNLSDLLFYYLCLMQNLSGLFFFYRISSTKEKLNSSPLKVKTAPGASSSLTTGANTENLGSSPRRSTAGSPVAGLNDTIMSSSPGGAGRLFITSC